MGRRYRVREIAEQSGLSQATVDRVLHGRPGVRETTVAEVHQAIEDLDRQATQVRVAGRRFIVDLVMHAPHRFSSAVKVALETELPTLRPAVVRARFHLEEEATTESLVRTLDQVARRGSHGVLLKAHDDPAIVAAIGRLKDAGIPVVTLVTDVPMSARVAYVGIDNVAAGATAAYLLTQWTAGSRGAVLVTTSSSSFRGEEQREMGFRTAMRQMAPGRTVRDVTDTLGLHDSMLAAVGTALTADRTIDAVYSPGGGNLATLEAFAAADRPCRAFVAHDLDEDNTALLRQRRISAVLHHDLRQDIRRCCRVVMQVHGALPGVPTSVPSQVQVITPFNEPGAWPDA